jgi:hypothetical protein
MITTQFPTNVNYRIPQLFRYTNKEFVNAFLLNGSLRLSSFEKFRNDSHVERGDRQDGGAMLGALYKNGYSSVKLFEPKMAYVLCTSSLASSELMNQFEVDDCFVISDPMLFSFHISKLIPGCNNIFVGPCTYNVMPTKYFPTIEIDESQPLTPEHENEMKIFIQKSAGADFLFTKNVSYANQFEYRFVFQTNRAVGEYIDIVSEDAASLCMRATLLI